MLLAELVFFLETVQLGLHVRAVGTEAACMKAVDIDLLMLYQVLQLFVVEGLQQALSSLLHLDEATLEPLPEFVVGGATRVRAMPNAVLDELLDLVDPLRLQHVLVDRLDGNHEPRHVLNQDIVACDEQLIFLNAGGMLGASLQQGAAIRRRQATSSSMLTLASSSGRAR